MLKTSDVPDEIQRMMAFHEHNLCLLPSVPLEGVAGEKPWFSRALIKHST